MKNIYFAVALVLLVFLACSPTDGDVDGTGTSSSNGLGSRSSSSKGGSNQGSKPGACYFTLTLMDDYGDMCTEGRTESLTAANCREMLADMNSQPGMTGAYTVKFMNSCPSGQDLKCAIEDEGFMYLYGSFFEDKTCRDLEMDPIQSSNSKASSSSKGGGAQGGYCFWEEDDDCEKIPTGLNALDCIEEGGIPVAQCPNVPASSSSKKASSSSAGNSTSGNACYVYYEDYDNSVEWGFCIKPTTRSECNSFQDEEDDAIIRFSDSCPSNPRVTCPPSGGKNVYFYGYEADPDDCEYIDFLL